MPGSIPAALPRPTRTAGWPAGAHSMAAEDELPLFASLHCVGRRRVCRVPGPDVHEALLELVGCPIVPAEIRSSCLLRRVGIRPFARSCRPPRGQDAGPSMVPRFHGRYDKAEHLGAAAPRCSAQLRRISQRGTRQGSRRRRRRLRTYDGTVGNRLQWAALAASSLPGLAALAALLFTWVSVEQSGEQLRIAERGQVTGRFNAAIGNLSLSAVDVRLGGIYGLERLMRDARRTTSPPSSLS
ncbi:hypothetical protein FBY22_0735 [Streptomyces sp. SLBN-31]|nr:hypothetical protein FBY22_0735 [Streptomyces sp. SLBN-31]